MPAIGRVFAFAAAVLVAGPALADLDAGLAAVHRGDFKKALAELMPLAQAGDAEAQYNIGRMYAYGRGLPQDYAKALDWYRKSAVQGHLWAINNIGRLYQNGQGVTQDDAAAAQWYRLAADGGNGVAQYNLGSMYVRGRGIPQSNRDAHFWWSLALRGDISDDVRDGVKHDIKLVETHMSADEIAESRRLTQAWQPKKPTQLPPI
jgi:TPR repeat protein